MRGHATVVSECKSVVCVCGGGSLGVLALQLDTEDNNNHNNTSFYGTL